MSHGKQPTPKEHKNKTSCSTLLISYPWTTSGHENAHAFIISGSSKFIEGAFEGYHFSKFPTLFFAFRSHPKSSFPFFRIRCYKCVPAVHSQVLKTHGEDSSPIYASQSKTSNYYEPYRIIRKQEKESMLLIHPIGYGWSGQNKSLHDEGLTKAEHLSTTNALTAYFGQYMSSKKDPLLRNIASLDTYWQTVYVYARGIRYATEFSTAVGKRTSFNELLSFFKKRFCRPPTVICLIEQTTDNLINFQAV